MHLQDLVPGTYRVCTGYLKGPGQSMNLVLRGHSTKYISGMYVVLPVIYQVSDL